MVAGALDQHQAGARDALGEHAGGAQDPGVVLAAREPVRRRFRLDDDDVARPEGWVAASGIRWGLDAPHRQPFRLEGVSGGTWQAGLDPEMIYSLAFVMFIAGIVGARELPKVLHEWRNPAFEEFQERTVWSLFNAFTAALGSLQQSNPAELARRTMRLSSLLAPTVIDAPSAALAV